MAISDGLAQAGFESIDNVSAKDISMTISTMENRLRAVFLAYISFPPCSRHFDPASRCLFIPLLSTPRDSGH